MGVFGVTSIFSIFAYVWMFIVLSDQKVTPAEAWITFALFFVLILSSYAADRFKSRNDEKNDTLQIQNADKQDFNFKAIDIMRELIEE